MPRISITTDSGTVAEIIEISNEQLQRILGKSGSDMQKHCAKLDLTEDLKSALRTAAAMQARGD